MDYEKNNAVNMIEDGKHTGIISKVNEWNNPNGANKLIVEIDMENGVKFAHFFTPGFDSFDDLIEMTGSKPQAKGSIDEQKLVGKMVEFETVITTAKNGNDYCNVVTIKEADSNPFPEESKKKVK